MKMLACRKMHPEVIWRPGSTRTHWGSVSTPPGPLAAMRGPISNGNDDGGGKGRGGKRGEGT